MSQEKPLTPAERIALVQNDKERRAFQIGIAVFIIAFGIAYLTWFVVFKADSNFLNYMAVGVLALIFGGMGAAYAIFGLGRTVGSTNTANNEQIAIILAEIEKLKQPNVIEPPETSEFYENNFGDFDDDDLPVEVPPGKATDSAIAAAVAPSKLQYLADRDTWHKQIKQVNGSTVELVAIQESRRTKKKRTNYVYHIAGTNVIIYNRARHGVYFMRIAFRPENVKKFFQIFVEEPLTDAEKQWLERYDYILT